MIPRHPNSTSFMNDHDPNNDLNKTSIMAWLKLADFYQWPHILIFDSYTHLIQLLNSTNLSETSRRMGEFNRIENARVKSRWRRFLDKVKEGRLNRQSPLPRNVNSALKYGYGIQLDLKQCYGLKNESEEITSPDLPANIIKAERPIDGSGAAPGLVMAFD